MPFNEIPTPYLLTILQQIAMLLLHACRGDTQEAHIAAAATLAGYEPRTEQELRLAARIISFNLQAGEALAQAADPTMPLARVLRLRSGAVSLSRQAEKAEHMLEKLRRTGQPVQSEPIQPAPTQAKTETPDIAPSTETKGKIAAYAKAHGLSWTQAHQQREREKRLAERQARDAKRAAAVIANGVPTISAGAQVAGVGAPALTFGG